MKAAQRAYAQAGPTTRSLIGALLLVVILVLIVVVVSAVGTTSVQRTATTFLIAVAAVVGLGVYMGNSGIISFVHPGFMAVGAYASGILTLSPTLKPDLLPDLPGFIASGQLDPLPALLIAVVLSAAVAALIGLPLARLSGGSAAIYTVAWLIIIHFVLIGASGITRGASTFFGVPRYVTIWSALAVAVVAVIVARVYRDSRLGLDLRASREDELAARATGVRVFRARFIAFVLSAAIVAAAGALLGHSIGAFSPKQFYIVLATTYLAMLIVGGQQTVTGAVLGATAVTLLIEVTRRLEEGFSLGPLEVGSVFGLTQFALGVALLLSLYVRPEGLFGRSELDASIFRPWRRKPAAAGDQAGT
jgi:branched-chain amino acid transport system permease protein